MTCALLLFCSASFECFCLIRSTRELIETHTEICLLIILILNTEKLLLKHTVIKMMFMETDSLTSVLTTELGS